MDLSFLNEKTTAAIMIILGIIALIFPMISIKSIGLSSGFIVLLIAVGLLISGLAQISVSKLYGVLSILFSVICIAFAHQLMFNPALVSSLINFIVYLVGFIMIVIGILALFSGSVFKPFSLIGITTIVFGIITIITGIFINDPKILGFIIGIWLIVSGIVSLVADKNKNYIDI